MVDGDLHLHRIEDEIGEGRFERWLETGLETIEAYSEGHTSPPPEHLQERSAL